MHRFDEFSTENTWRFKETSGADRRTCDILIAEARKRINDRAKLSETVKWIKNSKRQMWQLRGLAQRWNIELPK